jgi:hypothetical protein
MERVLGQSIMFCQADNIRKSEQRFTRWVALGKYLVTPEDSRETVYRESADDLAVLPPYARTLKMLMCLGLAFGIAFVLSRLQ